MSPASVSVAMTGAPMFSPAVVSSATLLAPSSAAANSGALLVGATVAPDAAIGTDGASFLSVTVMVTVMVASSVSGLPSLALSSTVVAILLVVLVV